MLSPSVHGLKGKQLIRRDTIFSKKLVLSGRYRHIPFGPMRGPGEDRYVLSPELMKIVYCAFHTEGFVPNTQTNGENTRAVTFMAFSIAYCGEDGESCVSNELKASDRSSIPMDGYLYPPEHMLRVHTAMLKQSITCFVKGIPFQESNGLDIIATHHICRVPVADLSLAPSISSLTSGKINKGEKLVCTVIAPSFRRRNVYLLVKDQAGEVFQMSLYNFVGGDARNKDCQEMFPVGCILTIKEPYVKVFPLFNKGIRVDHPYNIEVKRSIPEIEIDDLKRGSSLFYARKFAEALVVYNRILVTKGSDQTVELGIVNSLIGLRRFSDALLRMKSFPANMVKSKGFLDVIDSSIATLEQAVQQQQFGDYSNAVEGQEEEYIGPIEVRAIPGKGRGMVATRDIRKGELILAEREFLPEISDTELDTYAGEFSTEYANNSVFTTFGEFIEVGIPLSIVIQTASLLNEKLLKYRHDRARFWLLYDGLCADPITDVPDMDMFRYDDHPLLEKYDVMPSIGDIKGRISYNCFGTSVVVENTKLYLVGSFFNHASSPNVKTDDSKFGLKTTVVKRNVAKGEELTISYGPDKMNKTEAVS